MNAASPPPFFSAEPTPRSKPRRPWREKFGDAFRGLKLGVRGHSSFSVHFFFAALALTAGLAFGCDRLEWALVIASIGLVLMAELFNSALESLYHGLDEANKPRVQACLDIAAGAVLLASGTALLIGGLVFGSRLANLLTSE
ncbi:MAG: diacylglycerol kinase [Gemmataceae bacterium]|nr:diacylglycerol kinase [Gemmataceae bacterium]MDW8267001.1 diacylglycerol kinase [Gemmataceae bacterium]